MKNGSADKRRNVGSGAQWRIENDTQTCIVPAATSGIVKYDRLLVKWDENIGCRACLSLAPVPPAAFSTPAPLRDNTGRSPVKWPCRFAFSGNPACYDLREKPLRDRDQTLVPPSRAVRSAFRSRKNALFANQRAVSVLFHARPRDFDFRIPGVWCHLTEVNRTTSPSNFLLDLRRRILDSRGWYRRVWNCLLHLVFCYCSIRNNVTDIDASLLVRGIEENLIFPLLAKGHRYLTKISTKFNSIDGSKERRWINQIAR